MQANARHTVIVLVGLLLFGTMFSYIAAAGVTTQQNSATNPDYIGFQVSTVVIRVQSDDADANTVLSHFLVKELRKRGVTAYLYDDIFPATQDWNDESMRLASKDLSVDGIMLVQRVSETYTGSSNNSASRVSQVRYSATSLPARSDQPSGRYGGGPPAAVGFGESTQGYPTGRSHAHTAEYQVALADWIQGREVWRSNIETRVNGRHSRHQQMGKGTAQGILQALAESEHIPTE